MHFSFAIVFVSDMKRSVSFYRDFLGLRLLFETSHWTELEAGGVKVALHLSEGAAAAEPPDREAPGTCRPAFHVPDLDAFHQRALAEGVECVQEPKETFGARLALYRDPDGLAFTVGQERSQG